MPRGARIAQQRHHLAAAVRRRHAHVREPPAQGNRGSQTDGRRATHADDGVAALHSPVEGAVDDARGDADHGGVEDAAVERGEERRLDAPREGDARGRGDDQRCADA